MRRNGALVGGAACLLLSGGLATAGPAVDACATRGDVLGLSRIVEVDTAKGPQFGKTSSGEFDFLNDGEIVLTFDDGPSRHTTRAVLEALDAHCTKATFFMVGRMALTDPAMVREVAKHGHTIGTHTWSHAKLQTLDIAKAKDEIELGVSAVAHALQGPVAPFFRLPYLRSNKATIDYLKSRNFANFGIDVDSRDFKTRDGEAVKATVLAQLAKRKKGIVLFHDIQPSTAHALKDILDALKARGFKVVHLVPKAMAATLADYDTLVEREIARRKVASAKQQPAGNASKEVLPWAPSAAASPRTTKANALHKRGAMPWYMEWLQP